MELKVHPKCTTIAHLIQWFATFVYYIFLKYIYNKKIIFSITFKKSKSNNFPVKFKMAYKLNDSYIKYYV